MNTEEIKLALKYLAYNLKDNSRPLHPDYVNKLCRFAFAVLDGKSCEQAEIDCDL